MNPPRRPRQKGIPIQQTEPRTEHRTGYRTQIPEPKSPQKNRLCLLGGFFLKRPKLSIQFSDRGGRVGPLFLQVSLWATLAFQQEFGSYYCPAVPLLLRQGYFLIRFHPSPIFRFRKVSNFSAQKTHRHAPELPVDLSELPLFFRVKSLN